MKFWYLQELYLFVNEMRNFASALKDLLDMGVLLAGAGCVLPAIVFFMRFHQIVADTHTSTNALLAAIREALGRQRRRAVPDGRCGFSGCFVS